MITEYKITWFHSPIEPAYEIMALFVHRKLLQTGMRSHPVGIDVWFLVGSFVYVHTSCVRTAKALVAYVISTIISWAGSVLGLARAYKDGYDPSSFLWMFSLLLKELIFYFYLYEAGESQK